MTLTLSKELEKDLKHLEIITKKSRDFHVKEALIRYLEDMERYSGCFKMNEKKEYYTSKKLEKRLNL